MPGSSNASFIPKRNNVNRERRSTHRQVYVGTIIVRIVFIAVLLAVAVIFFYKNSLQKDLDVEVLGLSSALEAFNEADLQRVQLVDTKLKTVSELMAHTVSTRSILEAVESSILGSAQIVSFDLKREDRDTLSLSAQFEAPSFDAVLFQKGVFAKNPVLSLEQIQEISIESASAADGENVSGEISKLGFNATISIDAESVPHKVSEVVNSLPQDTLPATETQSDEAVTDSDTVDSNEEII